jgi:hypothetical protein
MKAPKIESGAFLCVIMRLLDGSRRTGLSARLTQRPQAGRLASLSRSCRGRLSTMEITVRAADLQAGDSLVRHGLVVRSVEEGGIGAEGRPVVVLAYEDGQSNTFLAERTFKVMRHLTEKHAQLRNNGTGD